jgi:glyoxylate carboligase
MPPAPITGAPARGPSFSVVRPISPILMMNSRLCEEIQNRAEAHGLEQQRGGIAALLARLMDLGRGHRFGERKFGVLHHHAAQQRHEKDAENAANDHQHGRFPVGCR